MSTQGKSNDLLWSTGQISKLTGIDIKTVRRWIDEGMLEGIRLPDMGLVAPERRVYHDTLRAFLVKYEFTRPVAKMDSIARQVEKESQ